MTDEIRKLLKSIESVENNTGIIANGSLRMKREEFILKQFHLVPRQSAGRLG